MKIQLIMGKVTRLSLDEISNYAIKTENFDQISVHFPVGRTLFSALSGTPFSRSCQNCVGKRKGCFPLAAAFSSFS